MQHAQDGLLNRYSPEDIADAADWDGDADAFFNALVDSGFIDKTDDGYKIHDWWDYAGKLIALRQKDAERKRNSRGKKPESEGNPTDVHGTSSGSLTESIRDLNPNPDLNPKKRSKKTYVAEFNEFWSFYPSGKGKAAAQKAFDKAANSGDEPELMIAGAKKYALECQKKGTPEDYIAHASTFINQKRYKDEEKKILPFQQQDKLVEKEVEPYFRPSG